LQRRDGDRGGDQDPRAQRALDAQLAVHRGGAVAEAEQPVSHVGPCAADAVVADLEPQRGFLHGDHELHAAGAGVPGGATVGHEDRDLVRGLG
jgi:hypothetical protein